MNALYKESGLCIAAAFSKVAVRRSKPDPERKDDSLSFVALVNMLMLVLEEDKTETLAACGRVQTDKHFFCRNPQALNRFVRGPAAIKV